MAKRQKAKKMAQRGATKKEIKKATGFGGKTAQYFIRNYAPAPSPPPPPPQTPPPSPAQPSTPAPSTPEIKGIRQGLRIAGAGGISGSDLKTIRKATDKSNEQLISKLDKINKNLRSKDKTGISLNAGALNKIIKKGVKQRAKDPFGIVDFGTGKLGMTIAGMMGTPGSAGRYVKGQLVGATEGTQPSFLPGGHQLSPGGRERDKGVGKQYELPGKYRQKDEVVDDGGGDNNNTLGNGNETLGGGQGNDTLGGGQGEDTIQPIEPVDTSLSSGAGGLDLASWATGFRRARSARQRAGRRAQGLASQKKTPFKSWNQ